MKYTLTPDLETGNKQIDNEHRELLKRINRLFDACSIGQGREEIWPSLLFLLDYVEIHFRHEDALQRSVNYPGYPEHHAFHEGYAEKLRALADAIPPYGVTDADLSALSRCFGILLNHVRTDDKKLSAYIQSH